MDKKYLSKIVQGSDTLYVKDLEAWDRISNLESYTDYLGVTTTEIVDGSSVNPVQIGAETKTAVLGNIVNYGSKEFIFNGQVWQEFGDMSGIGALGYKDNASGSVIAEGTNSSSAVTFTGTSEADFITGVDTAAVAPSFAEGAFNQGTLPSLGEATTSQFATEGVIATYNESNETLTFSAANKSNAVTAQGSFSAGTLPSKDADTFNAGSAATFNTAKAVTSIGTATAAAQTFTGSSVAVIVS